MLLILFHMPNYMNIIIITQIHSFPQITNKLTTYCANEPLKTIPTEDH